MSQFSMLSSTCVYMDLDNFGTAVEGLGWSSTSPNPVSRLLTHKIEELISRYFAIPVWGLDRKRGTEECILLFEQPTEEVLPELRAIKDSIENKAQEYNANTALSIGIAEGKINNIKPFKRLTHSNLKKYPLIYTAKQALKMSKKQGGNKIVRY